MDIGKRAIRRFGQRVAKLRKERRWTQLELAVQLGTDQVHISRIECGKVGPSLPMIARLAQAFNISISELMEGI